MRRLVLCFALAWGCGPTESSAPQAEAFRLSIARQRGYADGQLQRLIANMDDGTAQTSYALLVGGNHLIRLHADDNQVGELQTGSFVRAYGTFRDDESVDLTELEHRGTPIPLINPEPYPARHIGLVLIGWEGANNGMPNRRGHERLFRDVDSTLVFYAQNSYGRERFTGDVFGPYSMERPNSCDTTYIANQAMAMMGERGHDPNEWSQLMFHFPSMSCGFGGLGALGSVEYPGKFSWYNGGFDCVVRNQELGHNYGMSHSYRYACADADGEYIPFAENPSETCEHIEYGDPYDPMGAGCGHMNIAQKSYMGWVDGCNFVETRTNGRFALMPTELPCDGIQALRFPTHEGRYYYLEYRKSGLGPFAPIDGVLVHVAGHVEGPPGPYFLNMGSNRPLVEGDSYESPTGHVRFTVAEMDDHRALIDVTFAEPEASSMPTCRDGAEAPQIEPGLWGDLACASEIPGPDMQPPTVELIYPRDGDVFEPGASFFIRVEAHDDRVVGDVQLYINNERIKRDMEPPFEFEVAGIPEGTYGIGVEASDGTHKVASEYIHIRVGKAPVAAGSSGEANDGSGETASGTGEATGRIDNDTDGLTGETGNPQSGGSGGGCSLHALGGSPMGLFMLAPVAMRRRRRGQTGA